MQVNFLLISYVLLIFPFCSEKHLSYKEQHVHVQYFHKKNWAKRKRKLRQETKQKIDEKKLKNKLRVKRHREKINFFYENTAHARVVPCNSDVFRNRMEKSRAHKKLKESSFLVLVFVFFLLHNFDYALYVGLANFTFWIFIFIVLRAKKFIFAYFRTDFSFPAITMLNLEVSPQNNENKYSERKICQSYI
jgi:hypothetical protein